MAWRSFTLLILAYVTLDLSSPFVAGAFNFDPDECIDGIQHPGGRITSRVEQASTPLTAAIAPGRPLTAPGVTAPRPGSSQIVGDWLIDVRRSHAPARAPSGTGEDH
jgi:hypothetical protein